MESGAGVVPTRRLASYLWLFGVNNYCRADIVHLGRNRSEGVGGLVLICFLSGQRVSVPGIAFINNAATKNNNSINWRQPVFERQVSYIDPASRQFV